MPLEHQKQAKKLLTFADNPNLAIFDELQEANNTLKEIAAKEMPQMPEIPPIPEFPKPPEVQKISIEGAEVITIKGERGEKGDRGDIGLQGEKGKDGKDGVNGKNGIDGKDGRDGVNGLNGKDGKDGSPDTAEQVRDKLESFGDNDRLDKSAIKGLEDEIKKLREEMTTTKIISGPTRRKIRAQDLTSQCNGSTKTFTLPKKTTDIIGVFGTQFPVNFAPITDWTFSGTTLTLGGSVGAPATGQTLWALIESLN